MRGIAVAMAAGMIACGPSETPTAVVSAAPPTPAVVPPPTPPPAPTPTVFVDTAHMATFVRDELDECVSFERTLTVPVGVDWRPPPISLLDPPEGREILSLTQPCDVAFAGRLVLASCAATSDRAPREGEPAGVVGTVVATSRMFRFETALETDARMRDCLRSGGTWEAIREDSPEYAVARAEAELARLRRR